MRFVKKVDTSFQHNSMVCQNLTKCPLNSTTPDGDPPSCVNKGPPYVLSHPTPPDPPPPFPSVVKHNMLKESCTAWSDGRPRPPLLPALQPVCTRRNRPPNRFSNRFATTFDPPPPPSATRPKGHPLARRVVMSFENGQFFFHQIHGT